MNTLGFEVRTDQTMDGGFRWLTIGPPSQKDVEIVLMEPKAGPMFDEEAASAIRLLLKEACWDQACSKWTTAQDLRGAESQRRAVRRAARRAFLWH